MHKYNYNTSIYVYSDIHTRPMASHHNKVDLAQIHAADHTMIYCNVAKV